MSKTLCAILACLIAFVGTSPGAEPKPQQIIDNAIKAVGGKKALEKLRAMQWSEKGTYYGMGEGVPYTGKFAIQYPDQFRMEIEGFFISVVNKDKGWTQMGGETTPMTKEQLAQQRASNHSMWVSTLVAFAGKAPEYTLTGMGESKVNETATLGVKVARKGFPDVSLYFDKKTGLLVKSAYKIAAPELDNKVVLQEDFQSAHKEFNGVKIATKTVIKRDGKLYIESQAIKFEPVGKLDDKVFAKP